MFIHMYVILLLKNTKMKYTKQKTNKNENLQTD